MRRILAAACAAYLMPGWATESWLTVQGNPTDPAADTVQVAPETIAVFDTLRSVQVRVNRAARRDTYDGGQYQSYRATVEVNCQTKTAQFRRHQYFLVPLWTGESRIVEHQEGNLPPVMFRSLTPNPVQRIVQAACTLQEVKTR